MKDMQTYTQIDQDFGGISCMISHEDKLGRGDGGYRTGQSYVNATERAQRSRCARNIHSWVGPKVIFYLRTQSSLEQIEQQLPLNHKSVYLHEYANKAKSERVDKNLRTQKLRSRKCLTVHYWCGQIPHHQRISENYKHVDESKQVGQWLDFTVIVVDHHQAIVIMVGRKSVYAQLCKAPNNRANLVSQTIRHRLKPLGALMKTLRVNNVKEFAYRQQVDQTQGIQTYFDNSYCILERVSNESLNSLLHQYILNIRCMGEIS